MKSRAVIPLVVGLAIGIVAIRSFFNLLQEARGSGATDMVKIVRANVDIAPTAEITKEMIELVEVPKALAPEAPFQKLEGLVGRVTSQMIPSGVPIAPCLLAPEGTPPGMVARIQEGYRGVAVKIDEIAGVAGFISPGTRVDVLIVMSPKGHRGETISKVILQNVEVLAVGQKVENRNGKAEITRSVTVLVNPEDATKLHLASSKGKLRLALRNQDDRSEPKPVVLTDDDLLEDGPPSDGKTEQDGPSLLAHLFGKLAKVQPEPADKAVSESPGLAATEPPLSSPVAMAHPGGEEWVVEVLSGPQAYRVRFDSDRMDASEIRERSNRTTAPPENSVRPTSFGPRSPAFSPETTIRWDTVEPQTDQANPGTDPSDNSASAEESRQQNGV
jgi:pilus assembly protein CpaB